MKAYNDKRAQVEYARIHRIIRTGSMFEPIDFAQDAFDVLNAAQESDLTGSYREHSWTLGNLEREDGVENFSGQFGWYEVATDPDAIPPRDPVTHMWLEETQSIRVGALALFAVDVVSQRVAITSRSGDVTIPAFCHAMTQILNNQEISMKLAFATRPDVDWLVEPVPEVGVFRSWVRRQETVRSISVAFHWPNPDITAELLPLTNFLNESNATGGLIRATNDRGESLTPENSPILRAGIAMQENNYADINANGIESGKENAFSSKKHGASDAVPVTTAGRPSVREMIAVLFEAMAARIRREGGDHGDT
jgi:hypothetical protein